MNDFLIALLIYIIGLIIGGMTANMINANDVGCFLIFLPYSIMTVYFINRGLKR